MATRSTIWNLKEDGILRGVYCHWDGYPKNNGKILQEHYNSVEKLDKLINGGSLSSLKIEIDKNDDVEHSYGNFQENVCVYHHRDLGHGLTIYELDTLDDIKDYLEEYNYIFKENKWYLYVNGKLTKLKIKE